MYAVADKTTCFNKCYCHFMALHKKVDAEAIKRKLYRPQRSTPFTPAELHPCLNGFLLIGSDPMPPKQVHDRWFAKDGKCLKSLKC